MLRVLIQNAMHTTQHNNKYYYSFIFYYPFLNNISTYFFLFFVFFFLQNRVDFIQHKIVFSLQRRKSHGKLKITTHWLGPIRIQFRRLKQGLTCFTQIHLEKITKNKQTIFLCKNRRFMPLTFGMQLDLVDYQDCSNYSPGIIMVQPQGSLILHSHISGKNLLVSKTRRPRFSYMICSFCQRVFTKIVQIMAGVKMALYWRITKNMPI